MFTEDSLKMLPTLTSDSHDDVPDERLWCNDFSDSESDIELPQFSHCESNVLRMMENMEYDLTSGPA